MWKLLASLAAAGAGVVTTAAGAEAAAITWSATRTTALSIYPNGARSAPTADASGRIVTFADGSVRTAPPGWHVWGTRDSDGAAFIERSLDVVYQSDDGHGGHTYSSLLVPKTVVEFAWMAPHEGGIHKIIATRGDAWPTPAQGFSQPDRVGVIDGGVFVKMSDFQPYPDGLFDIANSGDTTVRDYREPWVMSALSTDGTAFLNGTNDRRAHWAWAMPTAGGGAQIDFVRQPDVNTGAGIGFNGTTRDGRVLVTEWIEGQETVSRTLPSGRSFTCAVNTVPLARLADDGGYATGGCIGAGTKTYDVTVTSPDGDGQHWRGAPLAFSLLIGGWLSGSREVAGVNRARLVVGGSERDLTDAVKLKQVGVIASVLGSDRSGRLLVRGADGIRWLLSRKAVLTGDIAGVDGAGVAGATITVDEPPSVAPRAAVRRRAARTVRTDAHGHFTLTTTAARVRLSVKGGCFAAAKGCATRITVPVGITTPPPVLGLGGKNGTTAPVMAAALAPVALRLSSGRLALPVRCLLAKRCAGTAKVVLGRTTLGSAALGIAANRKASVGVKLTTAGAKLVTATARAGKFVLVVGGRTVTVPVTVRR